MPKVFTQSYQNRHRHIYQLEGKEVIKRLEAAHHILVIIKNLRLPWWREPHPLPGWRTAHE